MTEFTDRTDDRSLRGTIFYDGQCSICTAGAERWREMLHRRGFELMPLQAPDVANRLRVPKERLLDEVRLLASDGRVLGGADAILHVARFVWWGWPIWLISLVPGMTPLLRAAYRAFVPYRYCVVGRCGETSPIGRLVDLIVAWSALILLPILAGIVGWHLAPWQFMWLIAAAIFFGCKWLTWRIAPEHLRRNRARSLAYLLAWPGMNPREFLDPSRCATKPAAAEWMRAILKTLSGAGLVWGLVRFALPDHPLLAGWIGMIGLILMLHFGTFDLLSLAWRSAGIDARPIMNRALASTSPADFWGRRWNRGFSDLMRRFVLAPMRRPLGSAGAVVLVFLISGLLHELVITLPARGGWGGPTAYFLIQAVAILLERFWLGRSRLFAVIVTLAPLPLLFPPVFIDRVILPFMNDIGATKAFSIGSPDLATAIIIGGVLHFGILIASALVPQVLDWRRELAKLSPLSRQLVWTHGAFIVLTIIGFALISILAADELADGGTLARLVCGFVALFWLVRLLLQFVLFDARPFLQTALLKLGYHGLTLVFATLVLTYSWAAIAPSTVRS